MLCIFNINKKRTASALFSVDEAPKELIENTSDDFESDTSTSERSFRATKIAIAAFGRFALRGIQLNSNQLETS